MSRAYLSTITSSLSRGVGVFALVDERTRALREPERVLLHVGLEPAFLGVRVRDAERKPEREQDEERDREVAREKPAPHGMASGSANR